MIQCTNPTSRQGSVASVAKVTERYANRGSRPLIACDFSPPRSGAPEFVRQVEALDVDFICVAYSPGKSVRLDSAVAAANIRGQAHKDVIFNLATRDMNKLAIQMHLLGAQALELENVLVVKGDDFSERELARVKDVNDYKPTELIEAIRSMNDGVDFKGLKLRSPTAFCVGATVDLSRGLDREARLARQKLSAGAEFLVTQSVYDAAQAKEFRQRYEVIAGEGLTAPTFFGVPILEKDGLAFGEVPEGILRELHKGRPGVDIALELIHALMREAAADAFFLVPPILRGGARDYSIVEEVLAALGSLSRP